MCHLWSSVPRNKYARSTLSGFKKISTYNCIGILLKCPQKVLRLYNRELQVHMEGQESRVCQEEIVLHPDNVDQHEEKKFKSL